MRSSDGRFGLSCLRPARTFFFRYWIESAGERVAHYETIRKRKDGSLVEVSLTVSPIYDEEGGIIGASKIARDLTAVREAQRERERTREFFLAALGHDLRNPLNTIVVSLALLQNRIPEACAMFQSE
jgi:signal transduction histidine kinase